MGSRQRRNAPSGKKSGMADWSSYFARMEGAPISIAVDLALRDAAPIPGKPAAYTVAVALRQPDEHGMTSEGSTARFRRSKKN